MADKITITINKDLYKKLVQIKLDEDLRTFDDVLEFMFKSKKSKKH